MRWPRLRRKPSAELEHARRERRRAEERLRHDEEHVIVPLREIRERNHVADDISRLIRRRLEQGRGAT